MHSCGCRSQEGRAGGRIKLITATPRIALIFNEARSRCAAIKMPPGMAMGAEGLCYSPNPALDRSKPVVHVKRLTHFLTPVLTPGQPFRRAICYRFTETRQRWLTTKAHQGLPYYCLPSAAQERVLRVCQVGKSRKQCHDSLRSLPQQNVLVSHPG